jgi:hypothetical protein
LNYAVLIRDGAESLTECFLMRNAPSWLALEFLLRRHKGQFYRKHYPTLSLLQEPSKPIGRSQPSLAAEVFDLKAKGSRTIKRHSLTRNWFLNPYHAEFFEVKASHVPPQPVYMVSKTMMIFLASNCV